MYKWGIFLFTHLLISCQSGSWDPANSNDQSNHPHNPNDHAKPEGPLQVPTDLAERVAFYKNRYALADVYQKRVDNKGNGDLNLYGARNVRVVLHGVMYRGGANNFYHMTNPRDNRNPLPTDGLQNLCEEGFPNAVYLYSTNFSTAPPTTTCSLKAGETRLDYFQINPFESSGQRKILGKVMDSIRGVTQGPIYTHCWNGWHASGLISALALRQFCDWSGDAAVEYWDKNTDGFNSDLEYEGHRNKIRNFQPFAEYKIDDDLKKLICP